MSIHLVATTVRRFHRSLGRAAVVVLATFGILVGTVGTSSAALNTWYTVPSYAGAVASAKMTYMNTTYGSGSAGGQVYLRGYGGQKLYIQFKPNEGGTWNRLSQNNTTNNGYYYNWSDNFTFNYSGFMFRICKDQTGPDACGSAVQIRR